MGIPFEIGELASAEITEEVRRLHITCCYISIAQAAVHETFIPNYFHLFNCSPCNLAQPTNSTLRTCWINIVKMCFFCWRCWRKTKGYRKILKYIFVHLTSIKWNTEFICHHMKRKLLLIAGLLSTLSPACLQWQSVWISLRQLYSISLVVVSVYDLSNDEAVKVPELVQAPLGPQGQRVTKGEENPY